MSLLVAFFNALGAMFEWLLAFDLYFLRFSKDMTIYVIAKAITIIKEYSRIPYHLIFSAIELITFGLFVGYPAFRYGRRLYRSDKNIRKNVPYGLGESQFLDIYVASDVEDIKAQNLAPVVIFIQGGGWAVCNKDFYAAMGIALRKYGIVTVIPNYTAFPKGDIRHMIDDVRACVSWTIQHISEYGGNPNRIYVAGHSAGAHLSAMAVLTELEEHLEAGTARFNVPVGDISKSKSSPSFSSLLDATQWKWSGIRHLILVSGPYHIPLLFRNMEREGKAKFSGLSDIFNGNENFERYSPVFLFQKMVASRQPMAVSLRMPPVTLVHATKDKTIPVEGLKQMDTALRQIGIHGKTIFYEGHSHTEAMMEVLEGFDNARMLLDIVKVVNTGTVFESKEENKSLSWRFRSLLMRVLSPV